MSVKYKNSSEPDLKKIVRFFDRNVSRYIFLVIDDERILNYLIITIQVDLRGKKKRIRKLELTEKEPSVYRQVKNFVAGKKSDGLIVTGLNPLIYKYNHECLDLLNKSRDAFKKFGLPIAFIVNTDNLSKIINGASDFYQLRDLPDFHFKSLATPVSIFANMPFQYRDKMADSDLKAVLLEVQLEILKKKQTLDKDLLNSIVVPLLEIYIAGSHYEKMKTLFNDYLKGNEDKIKNRKVLQDYYLKIIEIEKVPVYPEEGKKYFEDLIEARRDYIQAGEWNRAAEITFDLERYLTLHGFLPLFMELLQELDIAKMSNQHQVVTYGQMGTLYFHFGEYDKSMSLHKKAYEIAENINDNLSVAAALLEIGTIYKAKRNYDEALRHYEKSLEVSEKIGDSLGLSHSLHQIGMIYEAKGRYDEALRNYEKSLEIKEKIGDIAGAAISRGQIGSIYFRKNDYPLALKFCLQTYPVLLKLESPTAEIVKRNILKIREQMPGEQFEEILKSFNVKLE